MEKTAAKVHMKGATAQKTVDLPTRTLEKLPGKTPDKYNTVKHISYVLNNDLLFFYKTDPLL